MTEISYDYDIPAAAGHGRKGFTQTLREMRRGGSVEVPKEKKASIYSAAKAAGAKVRIRATDHNTVRVWRLDGEEPPETSNYGLNIFGELVKTATKTEPLK